MYAHSHLKGYLVFGPQLSIQCTSPFRPSSKRVPPTQQLICDQDRYGKVNSLEDIKVVGHRVVHGGEKNHNSVLIDPSVMDAIKEATPMAPLHNPVNIACIEAAQQTFSTVPQV